MKRKPTLARGLAKYQKKEEKRNNKKQRVSQDNKLEVSRKQKKQSLQKVLHSWSDKHRTLHPFRPSTGRMLILGEADFSFTRSLVEADIIPADQIMATCFEVDQSVLEHKYPNTALSNIEYLREKGCLVVFGVDATLLSEKYLNDLRKGDGGQQSSLPFDRIVFNFPHTGEGIKDRDLNIRAQQKLVSAFLHSASQLLQEQQKKGQEAVKKKRYYEEDPIKEVTRWTIMARPSQIAALYEPVCLQPEIHLTCWTGDPYDDWNIRGLAKEVGTLVGKDSFPFESDRYPRYRHCRTIGFVENDDTFDRRPARTHVFTLK